MENQFGNKLKRLRESNNWSQEKLAEELDVSRQSVYKWEANKGYPNMDKLIKISDMFHVTIDELVKSDEILGEEQQMDETEEDWSFEQFADPGFYFGIILIILGAFLFEDGNISKTLIVLGALTMIFFTDMLKSFKSLLKNKKGYKIK